MKDDFIEVTRTDLKNLCDEYDEALTMAATHILFKYENAEEPVNLPMKNVKANIDFYKEVYNLETLEHPVKISIKL